MKKKMKINLLAKRGIKFLMMNLNRRKVISVLLKVKVM